MRARVQLIVFGVCALVVGGSLLTLQWVADSVADLGLSPPPPDDAGRELDPDTVAWLSYPPDRTLVDPAALRTGLERLRAEVDTVLPVRATDPPDPRIDRTFVPAGWNESSSVTVLIGAEQRTSITEPAERCSFLRETADQLAALGWTLSVRKTAAIQTEYPLVSPGPQDLELLGESALGSLSLGAPADGTYGLTYGVEAQHLDADDTAPSPTNAPLIPCD